MNKPQITLAAQAATMFLCLLSLSNADAEIRTITATGEYRMGDNDTRIDAKRLALLDAKRLALEQAGTYIESITQVKNFDLTKEEIRAYTAGIVEVIEHATHTTMEGETTVVRVDVIVRIDSDVLLKQIETLRQNESTRSELLRLRAQAEQLEQKVKAQTKELSALKAKAEVEPVLMQRRQLLNWLRASDLLLKASTALLEATEESVDSRRTTQVGYAKVETLVEQALDLDPLNPDAHYLMGQIRYNQANYEAAIIEYKLAVRFKPHDAGFHHGLADALRRKGDLPQAIDEHRTAVRLDQASPTYHLALGIALKLNGDLQGAISEFRTGLELAVQPHSSIHDLGPRFRKEYLAQTHHVLGNLFAEARDWASAISEYRSSLLLLPDNVEVRVNLGHALLAEGRVKEGTVCSAPLESSHQCGLLSEQFPDPLFGSLPDRCSWGKCVSHVSPVPRPIRHQTASASCWARNCTGLRYLRA